MKLFLPLFLGACAVLQAELNKRISIGWGLSRALVINSSILFICAWTAFWWFKSHQPPELFHKQTVQGDFQWWFVLPGLCGLALVAGLPFSMTQLGAGTTFIVVTATQMGLALLLDALSGGVPFSFQKALAALLVVIAIWLNQRV